MRARLGRLVHWKYLVPTLVVLVALGVAATATGVTVASEMEKSNTFCSSCHTEPESTYVARFSAALSGAAPDLAAYHFRHSQSVIQPPVDNIRCVDCHVGEGVLGRATVLSLAAFDALKYYTRTARQPAQVVFNVQNEACLKCHEQDVKRFADQPARPFIIDNHFHYKYFQAGAPPVTCTDCHVAHKEGTDLNQYQFRKVTVPFCEACHRFEGHGPVKMQ